MEVDIYECYSSPDGTFVKDVLVRGQESSDKPRECSECKVTISDVNAEEESVFENSVYFRNDFNGILVIGESDTDIDLALERCVTTMFPSERCNARFYPEQMSSGVTCSIRLECVKNEELVCDWDSDKKFQTMVRHKERGVELYKLRRVSDAFRRFSKAFKLLLSIDPIPDDESLTVEEPEHVRSMRVVLYNNVASCKLHCQKYQHVVELCDKALAIEPNNIKSLYRRAVALMELKIYDEAQESLSRILSLDPHNVTAKQKLKDLKNQTKDNDAKYVTVVKKMFS
ncbi:FK506-binding protein-like [Bacillus rossius redtenbacheri]|uniref:FK506-binding protein-like n=1 Tax=Bacillus rossius redtenbacheri TaxID=93214 RepID=UPI002FDE169B